MTPGKHVLLVEDNLIDALLFEQALRIARPESTLSRVPDVMAAVYYLRGIGFYADRTAHPLPYLVAIDLNLGTVSGMELLKWIKKEPAMKGLITVVLTASEADVDADAAHDNGVNSYLRKRHDRDALVTSLTLLHQSWRRQNLLPPSETQPT